MALWRRFIRFISQFWCRHFVTHYLIIGQHTKKPIGCTFGKKGQRQVIVEQRHAKYHSTFKKVKFKDCPLCQKVKVEL